jgi:hypothetical protein
MEERIT